ncbi:retrovirus-related pol polyprotein from transposon TNT 1-94, partial [Tanacetum coccineum]
NACLQEKVLVITTLKDELRKLKGKDLANNKVTHHPSDPEINTEPITPKLLNKRSAHSAYIKHTQEEAAVLRDLVEHVKSKYPLDHSLESACRYAKLIQELLTNISQTCPSINNSGEQLVAVTPMNKVKRVRFIEPATSSRNTILKRTFTSNLVSNKPMLSSTGVKPSTSASGSQPSGNTKKDKIQQTQSSTQKNKVEAHPRKVKSSLKNKDHVVAPKGTAHVQHSKLNANSELKCVKCNGCMLSDNHDLCVLDYINNVNARAKSKSAKKQTKRKRPTGRTFTIVGNACPLTRITTTTEVPLRKPTALENETPKLVVTLVYSRKPRKSQTNVPVSKSKVLKSVSANKKEPNQSWGPIVSDVPYSSLDECKSSKLFSVKFENDHMEKIIGYGDYQIGNVTISRVYYVEGLGHNLFSVGQFCDSNLEVAFRQHTCFIRNLEGVDLLTGSRGNNLYTLSLGDMMASSPICLLSKASKTKSWLWHRRLSHLNFGTINHLARHGLVRGLPKLKFEKDHLCSACAMGKSKKKPHKPKSEDTNQEKLYLLHMDLCGPMRVASVNGKKYILVIVDDYSRFTWVKCLRSKDEAPDFIIKFLKMIQVRLKVPVRRIRTDNGTEFVNQTLREYYEKVGISHETSVARSPQQNGVVERRNRTLIEAARTMLIYAKAPLFLWAEAVATACYTQNRSIIRLRHGKTPYELLHDKPPDLSFFHVFGALCYPTNDSENLGKLQPKADIADCNGFCPPSLTPFVPPSRTDWDIFFQPMFDELLTPPPSVDYPATEVVAPIQEVVAPVPAVSTGSHSSTNVDQDAPSPSHSQTTPETQPLVIPNDVEEDNYDIKIAHMGNDPYFDKVMVITLKWIYKVKLDELGGILKNKAWSKTVLPMLRTTQPSGNTKKVIKISANTKFRFLNGSCINKKEPSKSWGSIVSDVPSSSLDECRSSKLFSVKFGNDHVAKILGYGDYQIGNVTISRVYYVEGLGHNLFSVGKFCDSNLEVAFCQHTCFIRNLEGVDLLTGSRGNNLYTLSLIDTVLFMVSLSLNLKRTIVSVLCNGYKAIINPTNLKQETLTKVKLYLLHMDLCGPIRVASINGKKYILVIVDDYSRFTWVKFLRSKDEAPDFIVKFLKMIQVRLKVTVRRNKTDNGTEFVNQTLREYYEKVGISHETSVAHSPQQNGVVERRNRTLIEVARTMLIYAKAPLFLWAEAVATACYTQNRSIVHLCYGKTPYELLHDKPPDLLFFHVFGALCYPTNDSENLDFDELTAMASEHNNSGPALHEMTSTTISSGLVPNPPPSTLFVPPSRTGLKKVPSHTTYAETGNITYACQNHTVDCADIEERQSWTPIYAMHNPPHPFHAVLNLSGALFQSHGGRDISSLAIICVLRISGFYTSRLLDAACKKVLNLLKKGLLKVEAILKSAWTEKDQIDKLLERKKVNEELRNVRWRKRKKREYAANPEMGATLEQTQQGVSDEVLRRFYTSARNPVKEILLKLNLPDHRSILTDSKILKDGGAKVPDSIQLTSQDS